MAKPRTGKAPRLAVAEEIPDLQSEAAAAHWYDSHDTSRLRTESVDDHTPARGGLETIAVRVSRVEIEELKLRAKQLGIGYTTYVRMLINRHVLREAPIQ